MELDARRKALVEQEIPTCQQQIISWQMRLAGAQKQLELLNELLAEEGAVKPRIRRQAPKELTNGAE